MDPPKVPASLLTTPRQVPEGASLPLGKPSHPFTVPYFFPSGVPMSSSGGREGLEGVVMVYTLLHPIQERGDMASSLLSCPEE